MEKIPQPAEVNRESQKLRQLLIFPTRFKDIYRQQFFPLYTAFIRSLAQAQLMIVVGHSLRDEYLLAAIRERLREGDFHLIVFDPSFPAENSLRTDETDEDWSSKVAHVNRTLETISPILTQAVEDADPIEAFNRVMKAIDLLRRGRKDKVSMSDANRWHDAGDVVSMKLAVDTVVGGGSVRCWIDIDKNKKRREELSVEIEEAADGWQVNGVVCETRDATFRIPTELPAGDHLLTAAIQRPDHHVIARDTRTLSIRQE